MSQAVMIATERAKADKAWYLSQVRDKLNITSRDAYDLYRMGKIPGAFPMPAIRLEVDYLYRWPTNEAIACVIWKDAECVAFYP